MTQRKHVLIITLLIIVIVCSNSMSFAQEGQEAVQGSVIMGRPVGGSVITFQDLRSDSVWQVEMPDSSYSIYSWSPDGCHLLLRGSDRWKLLSVIGKTIKEIPLSSTDGQLAISYGLIWSPDGKTLIESFGVNNNGTRLYSVNISTFERELILSLDKTARALRWFSQTELLYETEDGYFIWDETTMKSRQFQQLHRIPLDWASEVYPSIASPNGELLGRYYSLIALKSITSDLPEDADSQYIATVEAIAKEPGFDVYFLNDGSTKHIDVMGQFLQSLEWSPASERLVVSTYPPATLDRINGIYVYDLKTDALQRVGDFPAMLNSEYGQYFPSWSSDSNWLAFNTPTGYVAYNLIAQETVKLSEQFSNSYMNLFWSPIMDYSNSNCS